MSASTTGADAANGGASKSRDHNQGNQDRKYTLEQKTAVVRVRRCSPTAFYDILGLEEVKLTVTDPEIKKAYRKLSLLTHPDKNGHEHADEAFKMVSRAFGVLSDPDKKSRFDKFGGDPDSRFGGQQAQSPFSARSPAGAGGAGRMWDDEISPEEMFNRFFGGGGPMGGGFGPFGGGMFDTGPQVFFNLGGGPGINVHHFGGTRPRRRPRNAQGEEQPAQPASLGSLAQFLPLLLLFLFPLLSSIFSSGSSTPAMPSVRYERHPPFTKHLKTSQFNVDYFVNPKDIEGFSSYKLKQLDQIAETSYVRQLSITCQEQTHRREIIIQDATGWGFFPPDENKLRQARNLDMTACDTLNALGNPRVY